MLNKFYDVFVVEVDEEEEVAVQVEVVLVVEADFHQEVVDFPLVVVQVVLVVVDHVFLVFFHHVSIVEIDFVRHFAILGSRSSSSSSSSSSSGSRIFSRSSKFHSEFSSMKNVVNESIILGSSSSSGSGSRIFSRSKNDFIDDKQRMKLKSFFQVVVRHRVVVAESSVAVRDFCFFFPFFNDQI